MWRMIHLKSLVRGCLVGIRGQTSPFQPHLGCGGSTEPVLGCGLGLLDLGLLAGRSQSHCDHFLVPKHLPKVFLLLWELELIFPESYWGGLVTFLLLFLPTLCCSGGEEGQTGCSGPGPCQDRECPQSSAIGCCGWHSLGDSGDAGPGPSHPPGSQGGEHSSHPSSTSARLTQPGQRGPGQDQLHPQQFDIGDEEHR